MTEQKKPELTNKGQAPTPFVQAQLEPCTRVIGAKVRYLQAHLGIMINHQSANGFHVDNDTSKHPPVDMTVTPIGVLCVFSAIRQFPKKRFLVPFTNIESLELDDSGDAA